MNRGEIRDLSRKKLGETTAAFWLDAELNSWIDESGYDLAFKTKSIKTNSYMTTTEDAAEYVLSTEFPTLIGIDQVYLYQDGATWQKLKPTSRTELDIENPGWKSVDSGTPFKYYLDREEDLFGLFIKPNSDNAGTDYIRAYYARTYTSLTDDAATPTLPTFLHMAMVSYVTALGYESRGWGDKANDAWSKYYGRIQEYLTTTNLEKQEDDTIIMKSIYNI